MRALEEKTNFPALYEQTQASELSSLREESFKAFSTLQKPNLKHEAWQYSSTRWLESKDWKLQEQSSESLADTNNSSENHLVFVDGIFKASESSFAGEDLEVKPLVESSELAKIHALFTENDKDYYHHLNHSFLNHGFSFHVTGEKVKVRLSFRWNSSSEKLACFHKNYFVVAENSELNLTEEHSSVGEAIVLASPYCDVLLKKHARMRYKKLVDDSKSLQQISGVRFYLEENATLQSFFVSLGGKFYRQDACIKLAGPNSEAWANGLYLSGEGQSSDYSFIINHESPDAKSHQYFKGVAGSSGKGVFQGKIVVGEKASKTAAKQLNKNILLSEEAKVYTKPQLQIDTDDVKCAHGATVSQIRDEELFYLQTRGLTKAEATSFLIEGFCHEILALEEKKDSEVFKSEVQSKIKNLLKG